MIGVRLAGLRCAEACELPLMVARTCRAMAHPDAWEAGGNRLKGDLG